MADSEYEPQPVNVTTGGGFASCQLLDITSFQVDSGKGKQQHAPRQSGLCRLYSATGQSTGLARTIRVGLSGRACFPWAIPKHLARW
ncbi:hypothetical protein CL614_05085 [archaeon]|nr:hypothetical protein [archaeon]